MNFVPIRGMGQARRRQMGNGRECRVSIRVGAITSHNSHRYTQLQLAAAEQA